MTLPLSAPDDEVRWCWPNLTTKIADIVSPEDRFYNCAAFIAGDSKKKWWPTDTEGYYWPRGFPRDDSTETILKTFETLFGFERCNDGTFEVGYEKIAIYELSGDPKHLAIQLTTTEWVCKLGRLEDIKHVALDNLDGPLYGKAGRFLRRRVRINQKDVTKAFHGVSATEL